MQYLTIYTPAGPMNGPPSPEHMAEMGKLIEEGFAKGWLVATGGTSKSEVGGSRVRLANGEFTVERWPFANDKLQKCGGFAVITAASDEDMLAMVKRFLTMAGDGESEVIRLLDMPPQG
jgi:hypothetical protein